MKHQSGRRQSLRTGAILLGSSLAAISHRESAAYFPLNHVAVNSMESHFSWGPWNYDRTFSGPPTSYINDITPAGLNAGGATYAWTSDPAGSPDSLFSVIFIPTPGATFIQGWGRWNVTFSRAVWFFDEGQYELGYPGVTWTVGGTALGIDHVFAAGTYTLDWTLSYSGSPDQPPLDQLTHFLVGAVFVPATVPAPMAAISGAVGVVWFANLGLRSRRNRNTR